MARGRGRSTNPLTIAAAAITRALDPIEPSRVTVLRLLADATRLLRETVADMDEADGRAAADRSYTALAYVSGAQAVAAAAFTCLMRLGARGGPLRQRAVVLFRIAAAVVARTSFLSQACVDARAHIAGLKRDSQTTREAFDSQVASALLVLAEASSPRLAGVEVAKESLLFLLGQKMKGLAARRGDVALAAAQVMAAHTKDRAPEPRVVERALEYALASASTKLGVGGVGSALLVCASCPFLEARGAAVMVGGESLVGAVSRALAAAPTQAEKNLWGVALARAVVATQGVGGGGSRMAEGEGSRVPARGGLAKLLSRGGSAAKDDGGGAAAEAEGWEDDALQGLPGAAAEKSNAGSQTELFEASLKHAAVLCAEDAEGGALWSVTTVLRMWSNASPELAPSIVTRAVQLLEPIITNSTMLTCVVDAILLGLWDDIRPKDAPAALTALLTLPRSGNLAQALSVFLAAEIVYTFGADAVATLSQRDSALDLVLGAVEVAFAANFSSLRSAGVALLSAVAGAVPQQRAMLLTVVLQNLRIADLQLAMKPREEPEPDVGSLAFVGEELSALLGNAAALASVVEELSCGRGPQSSNFSEVGPRALLAQCVADAEALLTPHPLANSAFPLGRAVAFVRKRAGWALLAALSCAGATDCFSEERIARLRPLWQLELGLPRSRNSENDVAADADGSAGNLSAGPKSERRTADGNAPRRSAGTAIVPFDEVKASSGSRVAALVTLASCLRVNSEAQFKEFAIALLGATAARLSVVDAGIVAFESAPMSFASAIAAAALCAQPDGRVDGLEIDIVAAAQTSGSFDSPSAECEGRRPFRLAVGRGGAAKDAAAVEEDAQRRLRKRTIARLLVAESERLLECVQLASPTGASAELCYHIAAAFGDEAQQTMGDGAGVLVSGGHVAPPSGGQGFQFPTFGFTEGGVMVNSRHGLTTRGVRARANTHGLYGLVPTSMSAGPSEGDGVEQHVGDDDLPRTALALEDIATLFNTDAAEPPLAERALRTASEAIAALIAGDRSVSGTLLESLVSSSSLTPVFSASIAFALSRRLSVSDLNGMGTGRVVASLQVLLRRALTGSLSLTELPANRSSKPNVAPVTGEPLTVQGLGEDAHGSALLTQMGLSWQAWATSFVSETACDEGCGHSEEFRVMKLAAAIRILTAEAYCELGRKAGSSMWLGLTRNVIEVLQDACDSSALSQVAAAANSCTVLGHMLGAVPAAPRDDEFSTGRSAFNLGMAESAAIGETSQLAVAALSAALEARDGYVQAAAASSLSDTSKWTAVNSEPLFANLVCAWAASEGGSGILNYQSREAEDAALAIASLRRSLCGMLGRESSPFFDFDAQGPGSCVGAYGMGAAAVLTACRQHWWPYNESCASAAGEIASDLIHWDPVASPRTVAAGLYCFAALWAARIDALRAEGTDDAVSTGSSRSSPSSLSSSFRSARGSRSPRGSTRVTPEARVPQSPLFSATPSNTFIEDLGGDLQWESSNLENCERLPLSAFDVGEVSHLHILRQVLLCISIPGRGALFREARTAGIAALAQFVRGVGPTCALDACPDFPQALFIAFDGGAAGADLMLSIFARTNVSRRLGFWISLCRSIFFGSVAETTSDTVKCLANASCATRLFAITVIRFVFEEAASSAGAEFMLLSNRDDTLSKCFSGSIDLASTACLGSESGAAEEGCKLLQCIFTFTPSLSTCFQCRDQISSALRHLLDGSCPYNVVQHAIRAGCMFLSHVCYDESLLTALMGNGKPHELHVMYKYDKCAEHVGVEAVLATLSEIAGLALSSQSSGEDLRNGLAVYLSSLRSILSAVVVDFASVLSGGIDVLAQHGGSITAAGVFPAALEASLMKHVGSIAFGAAALSLHVDSNGSVDARGHIPWSNANAPGSRMVDGTLGGGGICEIERVVLSVCTWLVNQRLESHARDGEDLKMFCLHVSNSLPRLICHEDLPEEDRIEALVSLRTLDSKTMLSACLAVSQSRISFSVNPALLHVAFTLCTNELTEDPTGTDLAMAFKAAGYLLSRFPSPEHRLESARTVVEVFLFLIRLPSIISLPQFAIAATQKAVVVSVLTAVEALGGASSADALLAEVTKAVERLACHDSSCGLAALASLVCGIGSAYPEALGLKAASIFDHDRDEVVDAMLVCESGPDFALACLSEGDRVRRVLPIQAVSGVFNALLRRMARGRGPPRQAAVCVLMKLHASAVTSTVQEALLSSLLPVLSRDITTGRDGAKDALQRLKHRDVAAFDRCVEYLSPVTQQATRNACALPE